MMQISSLTLTFFMKAKSAHDCSSLSQNFIISRLGYTVVIEKKGAIHNMHTIHSLSESCGQDKIKAVQKVLPKVFMKSKSAHDCSSLSQNFIIS